VCVSVCREKPRKPAFASLQVCVCVCVCVCMYVCVCVYVGVGVWLICPESPPLSFCRCVYERASK